MARKHIANNVNGHFQTSLLHSSYTLIIFLGFCRNVVTHYGRLHSSPTLYKNINDY